MSFKWPLPIAFCCVAALAVGVSAAAQTAATTPPPQSGEKQSKSIVYAVQSGSAKDMADLLNKHFASDAEFKRAQEGAGNLLVVNTKPSAYEEVLAALAKLDRRPQTVGVEIFILDKVALTAVAKKQMAGDFDSNDLSGPAERVLANIKAMQKNGHVSIHCHFQMVATEGKTATMAVGASHSVITGGITTTGLDGKQKTTYVRLNQDTHTRAAVRPFVGTDGLVTLDMQVEDKRIAPAEEGVAVARDEAGRLIPGTDFPVAGYFAKFSVKSGQAVLANDVQAKTKGGEVRTLVVVSAQIMP